MRWFRKSRPRSLYFVSDWVEVVQTQMNEYGLSPREQEIAWLLFEGSTNRAIGYHLSISDNTVKNHLTNIYEKTHSIYGGRTVVILKLLGILGKDTPEWQQPPSK